MSQKCISNKIHINRIQDFEDFEMKQKSTKMNNLKFLDNLKDNSSTTNNKLFKFCFYL